MHRSNLRGVFSLIDAKDFFPFMGMGLAYQIVLVPVTVAYKDRIFGIKNISIYIQNRTR